MIDFSGQFVASKMRQLKDGRVQRKVEREIIDLINNALDAQEKLA